jgi:hypothetical protein
LIGRHAIGFAPCWTAFFVSVLVTPCLAVDQPIDAAKLVIKKTTRGEKLIFVSRDGGFLFPALEGPDDAVSGNPGGLVIEIFSSVEGAASIAAGPASGDPGWTKKDSSVDLYRYRNKSAPGASSPVTAVVVREGKGLRVRSVGTGLPLTASHQSLGVRISFGATRSCALFTAAGVVKDEPGRFIGKNAAASTLTDCSAGSLLGLVCGDTLFPECGGSCPSGSVCSSQDLSACVCIADTDPCGSTFPTCNGECPVGEECANVGGAPINNCGCIPVGASPCGTDQCGGACPGGQECNFFESGHPFFIGCLCGPPGPCGSGGDDCQVGFFCGVDPVFGATCLPRLCSGGSYPVCGGTCAGGEVCIAFGLPGTFLGCICLPPGLPCESTCSAGWECPAGEACLQGPAGCGCEPF